MDDKKGWVFVIGMLVIFALMAVGMVRGIQSAVERAVSPVEKISGNIGTQVSSFLSKPSPTIQVNPMTIIRDIRSLSRLETIQYSVEKVITAETGQGSLAQLFGDKLIFIAHGTIIAGVDLAKLAPDDLWINNGALFLRLPQAEVFIATLDNDRSYVYDRQTGLFTKGDVNLETAARRVAEQEILKAALEDGILQTAAVNAENFLYRLLRDLGFTEIYFSGNTPTLTATP